MMRRGFTLAELLVSLALLAAVLAIAAASITTQWRADAALDARRSAHTQLVAGANAVASALRAAAGDALAADSGDVTVVSDTLLELRAPIGASIVCAIVDANTIDLPPASLDPPTLTWWTSMPASGDVLLVDSTSSAPSGTPDGWATRTIASVTQPTRACGGTPYDRASESALPKLRIRTVEPLPIGIAAGTLVRLARRTRWVHYRASDARWYLGQREWNSGAWTTTQPVAGPLRAPGSRGGLAMRAWDTTGRAVTGAALTSARVATVTLVLRADVPSLVARGRGAIDSVAVRSAPRNGTGRP